jgi:hypothetical protein
VALGRDPDYRRRVGNGEFAVFWNHSIEDRHGGPLACLFRIAIFNSILAAIFYGGIGYGLKSLFGGWRTRGAGMRWLSVAGWFLVSTIAFAQTTYTDLPSYCLDMSEASTPTLLAPPSLSPRASPRIFPLRTRYW